MKELETWATKKRQSLKQKKIKLTERFPAQGSIAPWKASIGLEYGTILVSYTVWERTTIQTELLILNTANKKTIVTNDSSPERPSVVWADLENVVRNLLNGNFEKQAIDA